MSGLRENKARGSGNCWLDLKTWRNTGVKCVTTIKNGHSENWADEIDPWVSARAKQTQILKKSSRLVLLQIFPYTVTSPFIYFSYIFF